MNKKNDREIKGGSRLIQGGQPAKGSESAKVVKEVRPKLVITVDEGEDEIIVIRHGVVHRGRKSLGRGACRDCSLNAGRGAKSCHWSMVCSNVLNGANFRVYETEAMKKAREERALARHDEAMAREYDGKRWNGD